MNLSPPRDRRPSALFILDSPAFEKIYGWGHFSEIARRVCVLAPPCSAAELERVAPFLAETELLFSGWGAPVMSESLLERMPRLRAIFYGAGTIRYFATDALWQRGIRVTSAASVNGDAVADYAAGAILFALKQGFGLARSVREARTYLDPRLPVPGVHGGSVALLSFGATARAVYRKLQPFGIRFLVYDPYLAPGAMPEGVPLVSLEQAFIEADVVSIHTPLLPATEGLVTAELLSSMRHGATLLNTARGRIIRSAELIDVLIARPDLTALLDVTDPEPPPRDSPLFTLPNVVLTPHVAGATDRECLRLGEFMVEELDRWLAGTPLSGEVTLAQLPLLA